MKLFIATAAAAAIGMVAANPAPAPVPAGIQADVLAARQVEARYLRQGGGRARHAARQAAASPGPVAYVTLSQYA